MSYTLLYIWELYVLCIKKRSPHTGDLFAYKKVAMFVPNWCVRLQIFIWGLV